MRKLSSKARHGNLGNHNADSGGVYSTRDRRDWRVGMDKTIWEYHLGIGKKQVLRVPAGAQAMSVSTRNGKAILWLYVSAEIGPEEEDFTVTVFRAEMDMVADVDNLEYIGVCIIDYVDPIHVFVDAGRKFQGINRNQIEQSIKMTIYETKSH